MEKGLTFKEALEKLRVIGPNEIEAHESKSSLSLLLSQFPTFINAILAGASLLSFIIGELVDGTFILSILLINAIFGFVQEYRAEKSLEKLKSYVKSIVRLIRDGKEQQVLSRELVPGDLVILSEGDRIPADGKLAIKKTIEIDESLLTGESLSIVKNHNDPVFSGTLVTKGSGRILVEKTGMLTRFGQIAQTLSTVSSDKTPLEKRLDSLAKTLSIIVVFTSALIVPLGLYQGKELFVSLLLAVSIGIAAIPEGLPAVVTIALAIGVNRMAKKRAIVRKMASIETLGAVQIILTDKTGTLTENSMKVKKFWVEKNQALSSLLKACVFGNTASLIEKAEKNAFDIVGDKTDGSLLLFAQQNNNLEDIKASGKILDEYSFDPQTKTVTTTVEHNGTKHVFVRGAPEVVLQNCRLKELERKNITELFESYAKEGLRVIGFGTKISNHTGSIKREEAEKDITFLGFVGIYDPPRREAKKAVHQARLAGIKTIMVTGDNPLTALSIAWEIGLIEEDEDVVTGEEMEKLPDEELEELILKTRIFARTRPEDKLRLVSLFKKQGYVVGVTGDGVNDALALKRADVGIAMGQKGTDVAREASDIVLTDDNFSSLVSAIEEGRTIYNNIVKAITYLLSGNLSEISLVFFATLLGMPNPLLPTQILWINLVTDGIPALALASDAKDPSVLRRKPRNPNAPILSNHRLVFILTVGFLLSILFLAIFKLLLDITSSETFARTIVFNALIFSHMTIAFIVRGGSIFKMNKFLIIGVLVTLLLQAMITFTPFFQNIFHLGF